MCGREQRRLSLAEGMLPHGLAQPRRVDEPRAAGPFELLLRSVRPRVDDAAQHPAGEGRLPEPRRTDEDDPPARRRVPGLIDGLLGHADAPLDLLDVEITEGERDALACDPQGGRAPGGASGGGAWAAEVAVF